ncbi:hypothetical protein [Proteiniphilum sp. X52]|uniref:PKD domain-containing protein n=1 Tax=Proteiniphilum sp. X52 TaxID=2382159 RepID=UPI00210166CC|nr:hypothetical protein [Proteiniphilum sp. X52]
MMKCKNTSRRDYANGRKHVFFKTLFIGFLAVFSFSVQAQDADNQEFWFVAPDASKKHDDRPTFLMITTGDKPATVTISMPKNPEFKQNFTDTVRTLGAYSYWKFEFEGDQVDIVENDYTKSGRVTNKGIQITSTSPVSAYYQIDGVKVNQKEIFTLKGKKAFGDDFYIPFQTKYGVSATYNEDAFRQIQIVATEDDTWVTVDPKGQLASPDDPRGYIDNTSNLQYRRKKLMKGETLLWRAYRRTTTGLTGTRVTADKPIAVTLFEDCLQGTAGSIDPIGDQLVPTGNLGKHYIVIKGYSNGSNSVTDNVVVVAVENDTKVYLDNSLQTTLNAGDHWSYDLGPGIQGKQGYYVNTSQPVYCMHQSAAATEIGGALLPSLYSISGRRITFIKNNSLPVSSMFLVFRDSAKDGFTLDGTPLTLNAQTAGFDDWMYAKVDLKSISGMEPVCTIANPDGSFALGYFNGSSTGTSLYGYLSAFGTFSFGSDTIYHCGNSYLFDAPYALSYEWTLPDNSISTDSRLEAKKSGSYVLKVNQDPYQITDETYLKLQNFSHTLNAPSKLLERKSYRFTIELNPQKDPDNYFKTEYEWTFGEGASIGTSTDPAAEVFYSTPGTKTVSLKIWNKDALCDTTITRTIEVLVAPEEMYWKTDAEDRNWNNEDNWVNAAGEPLSIVPSAYTKVYLPGNAAKYPSLKDDKDQHTDWSHYGQPETGEIVFRYGSELHHQHKLKYEKAYVNYNWGYYNNVFANGQQPPYSWENAKKLARDTWHILAAPLKSMASGDFSLAGYPFSWQKQFEVTTIPGNVAEGDFSRAFATNDMPLAGTNNAIAVKMAGYQNQTGYRQENLEGLKGVVEIPYFENKTVIPYYPTHNYDALSRKSYFYYFDTKTLKIINSPVGSMGRAGEAYRFIYETDQNEPPANGRYEMPLNTEGLGSTREIMVGNPLLAPIDAMAFANANTDKIDVGQGYKLLSEDGSIWEQNSFTEGNAIPAWKAFIVTLRPSVSTISFPLEANTLRATAASSITRTSYKANQADNALYMQILKNGIQSGDCAILQNNRNTNNPEIRKMILPEGHEAPEIFFMSSGRDLSYLIRNLAPDEKEIPIGVKTSDVRSRLSLEFRNIYAFTASTGAKAILVDKQLNVRQDLARNPVYVFTQQASGLDRQYVDKNRFVLQLSGESGTIEEDDPENGINVMYRSGILKITSDENIGAVSVYDLYGRLVFSAHSINLSQYSHPVSLRGKLFLVRVKTISGTVKVKKIMGEE